MKKEIIKRFLSSIILIPFSVFLIIKGSIYFNIFIIIFFLISIYEWHKMTKEKNYKIFGIFFLIFSFYTIYILRNKFEEGHIIILFVTLICVSTDIGGYIFGKILKGPRLTGISPKKTYSGSIGSYFLSLVFINIFLNNKYINFGIDHSINIYIVTFLISTISQLGDLTISYFKRLSNLKDTGKIIPGHGGLLDRIDGMIFAFPFIYIINLTNFFNYFK